MPASPRPIGCKLLRMSLAPTLRSRLVMALAICAMLWCDPAVAELVCAATPSCPHHARQAQRPSPAKLLPTIAGVTPCCPRHSAPLRTPADTPDCCIAGDSGAILPVASFVSGNSGPKHALPYAASALFTSASPRDRSLFFNSETSVSYIKPVLEQKTDLRI